MAKGISAVLIGLIVGWTLPSGAAIGPKGDHWVGGRWTPPLSLLSIRTQYSKPMKLGRIQLELGLKSGFPMCCEPGFYHVEMDPKLQRAVITLRKLAHAKYGDAYFKNVLEKSRYVESAEVMVDPIDKDMVIALYLKKDIVLTSKERTTKDRRTYLDLYLRKAK